LTKRAKVILVDAARLGTGATIEANAAKAGAEDDRLRPARAERQRASY